MSATNEFDFLCQLTDDKKYEMILYFLMFCQTTQHNKCLSQLITLDTSSVIYLQTVGKETTAVSFLVSDT